MADLADRIAAELCECWDIGLFWAQDGFTYAQPVQLAEVIRAFLTTDARAGAESHPGSPE